MSPNDGLNPVYAADTLRKFNAFVASLSLIGITDELDGPIGEIEKHLREWINDEPAIRRYPAIRYRDV